jgi:hypothetical protein
MPKESEGTHTPASIERISAQLQEIAMQILATAELMKTEPSLTSVAILHEQSLHRGMERLQTWADSCRSAVRDAKLELLRHHQPPVSDSPSSNDKRRQKK